MCRCGWPCAEVAPAEVVAIKRMTSGAALRRARRDASAASHRNAGFTSFCIQATRSASLRVQAEQLRRHTSASAACARSSLAGLRDQLKGRPETARSRGRRGRARRRPRRRRRSSRCAPAVADALGRVQDRLDDRALGLRPAEGAQVGPNGSPSVRPGGTWHVPARNALRSSPVSFMTSATENESFAQVRRPARAGPRRCRGRRSRAL